MICAICHGQVQKDGYGELVHKDTGFYGFYLAPLDDPKHGVLQHVAS